MACCMTPKAGLTRSPPFALLSQEILAKPGEAVIAFEGVSDRNAAEALKGTELFVKRAALPETAADEFYHADLIGLEAFDSEGRLMGRVSAIHNFGASDVIAIARSDGDEVLLAFTAETVPEIDVAGGRIEPSRCRKKTTEGVDPCRDDAGPPLS